jgi:hypothetical protein
MLALMKDDRLARISLATMALIAAVFTYMFVTTFWQ